MALLDDDFSAGVLMRICRILGAPKVADLIDFREDVPESRLKKAINGFTDRLEQKFKSKLFTFRDREKQSVVRYFIVSFKEGESIEGEPMIIINDFKEGIKADKNPVLDLQLVYDDIEDRDKDIEDLKFLLK